MARLYTSTLVPGKYNISFYFHSHGSGQGGLSVFTRSNGSSFSKLAWYYCSLLNASRDEWTEGFAVVNQETDFYVHFDGWKGKSIHGDIAIDAINISRIGEAVAVPAPDLFGLPITCNFQVDTCSSLDVFFYRRQFAFKRTTVRSTPGTGPDHVPTVIPRNYWLLMDTSDAPPLKGNMTAAAATIPFWPKCGCFYLDFYYHAYGSDLSRLEVQLEGVDTPLLVISPESKDEWVHMRRTFRTEEPTKLVFVGYSGSTELGDIALDNISITDCNDADAGCIPITTTPTTTTTTTPTTTTTAGITTPHPVGQHNCDFDEDFCGYVQPADSLMWEVVGSSSSRVPPTDITGQGMMAFVDSGQSAATNIASLTTETFIYNPNTCHVVRFRHSISEGTTGTLRVWLLTDSEVEVRQLWSSSTVTNGWADSVSIGFRYHNKFKLRFEAKRTTTTGGSNFALDNVTVPVVNCLDIPLYPLSDFSEATENSEGTRTEIVGSEGVIVSPNYPLSYPKSFIHTWVITVEQNATIELTVTDMDTELSSDTLEVRDGISDEIILFMSGNLELVNAKYRTTSNEAIIQFISDEETTLAGFRVAWEIVLPITTTQPVTTTTPMSYGYGTCSFDTVTDCSASITIMTDTDLRWEWKNGRSPNFPATGPANDSTTTTTDGGYMLMDSAAQVSEELGSFMYGPIFHNGGEHQMDFMYHGNGSNLGSLNVAVVPETVRRKRQADSSENIIWSSSNVAKTEWQNVVQNFMEEGPFYLKFIGKRKTNADQQFRDGDFAVDDLTVRAAPVVPTTTTVIPPHGGITRLTADDKCEIKSPLYPEPYDLGIQYSHEWEITKATGTVIVLVIEYLLTETCCDSVEILDPNLNDAVILKWSGSAPETPMYISSSNRMKIKFQTDVKVALGGFHFTCYSQAAPLTTTTTIALTTVGQLGSTGAQVNPGTSTMEWYVILIIVLLIIALIIIFILIVVICIRKRNARKNKISASQENLAGEDRKPIVYNDDYTAQNIYGHHYDRPSGSHYYDNGSMGGQTTSTHLNDSGHYGLMQWDSANIVTNPLKKKGGPVELDQNGQPTKRSRSKRAKKLDPLRGSRRSYTSRSENAGIISVPDGQGNPAPQSYTDHYQQDNPPAYHNA